MSAISFQPPRGRAVGRRTRTLRGILVLAAVLALVSLAGAGAAQANIQTFTVDSKATILFSGQVAVTGTIRCNTGDDFQVGVGLSQTQTGGTAGGTGNSGLGSCTGFTQTWAVGVSPSQGDFRNGSATGFVEALSPAVGGDLTALTTTIHLHK
jgi:hypothetical protein